MNKRKPSRQKKDSGYAELVNNVLTASRMNTLMKCPRQHYWNNEIGLRKLIVGIALRIGSAWARGMEARWHGLDYDAALAAAIPEGVDLNEYDIATIAALLAAYYEHYRTHEDVATLHPEVQFRRDLGLGFTTEGKLDGLGVMQDGRQCIIESKTTKDSLLPTSDYWLRLAFNIQLYQYTVESRHIGWDVTVIFYDVTRKPSIRPKYVNNLDKDKLKIVLNAQGNRVKLKNGKWKQSASKEAVETLKNHIETPDEWCDRLYFDCLERPEFYFARREVPVIDQQLEAFEYQRLALAKSIVAMRENMAELEQPEDAWPRNVSEHTCNFCQFKSFCLANISVNPAQPPEGYEVQPFNPELEEKENKCELDQQNESAA